MIHKAKNEDFIWVWGNALVVKKGIIRCATVVKIGNKNSQIPPSIEKRIQETSSLTRKTR